MHSALLQCLHLCSRSLKDLADSREPQRHLSCLGVCDKVEEGLQASLKHLGLAGPGVRQGWGVLWYWLVHCGRGSRVRVKVRGLLLGYCWLCPLSAIPVALVVKSLLHFKKEAFCLLFWSSLYILEVIYHISPQIFCFYV